jgi:hypothetical protein
MLSLSLFLGSKCLSFVEEVPESRHDVHLERVLGFGQLVEMQISTQ